MNFSNSLYALLVMTSASFHARRLASVRQALLSPLRGTVVEIGPGAGVNLPYYPKGIRLRGIEPNPVLRRLFLRRAYAQGVGAVDCVSAWNGGAPFPSPIDAFVSTLVLCTVRDPLALLTKMFYTLRPHGALIFIERTAASPHSFVAGIQRRLTPVCRSWGGGYELTRNTQELIQSCKWSHVRREEIPSPFGRPFGPIIAGVAFK